MTKKKGIKIYLQRQLSWLDTWIMTSKLGVKTIYRHIYIYIGKAWEWTVKAYSTLVLDGWTVSFSVQWDCVSLRITVLSLNLSRLGHNTNPATACLWETGKTNRPSGEERFFQRSATVHSKRTSCTSFQACFEYSNRRGAPTVTGKLIATTPVTCSFASYRFKHIL